VYVRDELAREELSEDDLAAEMGVAPSWLARKLNGQAPIDLADMVWWTRRFGPQVWPVIDDPSELEMPAPSRGPSTTCSRPPTPTEVTPSTDPAP